MVIVGVVLVLMETIMVSTGMWWTLLEKCPKHTTKRNFVMVLLEKSNGILMEAIGISVMISFGLLLFFFFFCRVKATISLFYFNIWSNGSFVQSLTYMCENNYRDCFLSQGECGNFIRLIEPWNRTHLYMCGTGAYNPVCTYVNRGRKPMVRVYSVQGMRVLNIVGCTWIPVRHRCSYCIYRYSFSRFLNKSIHYRLLQFIKCDFSLTVPLCHLLPR